MEEWHFKSVSFTNHTKGCAYTSSKGTEIENRGTTYTLSSLALQVSTDDFLGIDNASVFSFSIPEQTI